MAAETSKQQPLIIAPQTKIYGVALVLILVTKLLLLLTVGPVNSLTLFMLIYFLLMGIFGLVVINCTVTGSCNLVAWIMAYAYLIVSFFIALVGLTTLYKRT